LSGELFALVSALLWAVASVLLTVGAKRIHVVPLNLVRCVVSTIFFLALLPFFGGLEAVAAITPAAWFWLLVSVVMLLAVGDTIYFMSMKLAGVSWAMPVSGIMPFCVVLLAAFFVDEPLTWSLLAGALLVVAGVVLVSRTTDRAAVSSPQSSRARRRGLLLALGASVMWAIGNVALKPATAGLDPVVVNSVRQPMGMLMLLGFSLVRGRWRELGGLDGKSWGVIIVASLLGTGVGSLFFVLSIQLIGSGRTAVLVSTAPLMAIPFSMLWLQERPSWWTLAGTVLMVAGVVLVA